MRMKAVILAGGEGTRLRPVSSGMPKPMVPVLDKSALERVTELLFAHGVTDIIMTLHYMPEIISERFSGDHITCVTETEPLGTAGSVRACLGMLGDESFIVMAGDCVCDFDLSRSMEKHRESGAEASVILTHDASPLQYGCALLMPDGRISRFIEKPSWEAVATDLVSTGIYILSPSVLRGLPENVRLDFASDVFPEMLRSGRALYGIEESGYWCDIGTPESYLRCCEDILSGRCSVSLPRQRGAGIFSADEPPAGARLIPPCYIGEKTVIGAGAIIGPGAVIGAGSVIGSRCVIENSVVNGACLGNGCRADGAVICRGVKASDGCVFSPGSVTGGDASLGSGACVCSGARVERGEELPGGARALRGSSPAPELFISASGRAGLPSASFESCLRLGAAAAELFPSLGCAADDETALLCARAFSCSARERGADVTVLDARFPSQAAFGASLLGLPLTVCFSSGGTSLSIFGPSGERLSPSLRRRLEEALKPRGEEKKSERTGRELFFSCDEVYPACAAAFSFLPGPRRSRISVCLPGTNAADGAARRALTIAGIKLNDEDGCHVFSLSQDGFSLSAPDTDAGELSPGRLLMLLSLIEFENGCGCVSVPADAPAALELLAARSGSKVLRFPRDGEDASRLALSQPYLRHAPFALARLCCALEVRGENLRSLSRRVPRFSSVTRSVLLTKPRASVMRVMSGYCAEMGAEFDGGVRLRSGGGFVTLRPSGSENSVTVKCESENRETSERLCLEFEHLLHIAESGEI